jgi:V/A-type H+-transporting ATPase subunit B
MNAGVGEGKTRYDHRQLADQLYAAFARGKELRRLVSIVGEGALSPEDRRYLAFADDFENEFVGQGATSRPIEETLETAWDLLDRFPPAELKRIKRETFERRKAAAQTAPAET